MESHLIAVLDGIMPAGIAQHVCWTRKEIFSGTIPAPQPQSASIGTTSSYGCGAVFILLGCFKVEKEV
jgi:hypothetical protein